MFHLLWHDANYLTSLVELIVDVPLTVMDVPLLWHGANYLTLLVELIVSLLCDFLAKSRLTGVWLTRMY